MARLPSQLNGEWLKALGWRQIKCLDLRCWREPKTRALYSLKDALSLERVRVPSTSASGRNKPPSQS